ncbi:TRAP transporter substrate-binding protein [Jannaschia seohaensis]|uniref:Tripartite ATP-independent transporter DctP family solute receptor n=1 Tax=Jannaschia seohaensis TaxID=475081 RepID=A0A2Y9B0J3_9RHOB|nr:TRAP transporter substrate-binding protein [Jannaschia seohaensis]PWJ17060.1 tripartite ATP-independent transporter DctP family solute receptor [Jannaschia seohaensis]SSA48397.1 tripartite ATP-independent transporter solute receptor, DctP family [Jannaschia seohaensis]
MTIMRHVFGVAAVATLGAGAAQAQTYEMTLAHVLSDQSPYQVILEEFKSLVEERSGGDIAVEVQCCGQAGNEGRAIQSMRTGILTGGMVGGSTLETVVPAYRVLSLPYLFEDKSQAYEILQSEMGREMLDLLDEYGMHGLGFGSIYERSVATKAPARVESIDDMEGLKIRVLPTPGFVEAYKAMGTQPTPMSYGELFMAIQNNVVDALEISPDAIVADGFYEAVNTYTLTKAHQSTTVFVLSKSFWDGLPDDMKELVHTAALEAIDVGIAAHDKLADDGLVTAAEAGVEILEPDLAPFMESAKQSWDVILTDQPEATEFKERFEAFMAN